MSEFANQFLDCAYARLGAPFRDHEARILCDGGVITRDACMERGMDADNGYDCSGLVVASLCEVLSINRWPRELRHAAQMIDFAENGGARTDNHIEPGDVVCLSSEDGKRRTHVGIAVAPDIDVILHVSSVASKVTVSPPYTLEKVQSIAPETFQAYYDVARRYYRELGTRN